jgi:predicted nicotinamide N-methyase
VLSETGQAKYDLIIMADLIFNHSQQDKLLQTARAALNEHGKVLPFIN